MSEPEGRTGRWCARLVAWLIVGWIMAVVLLIAASAVMTFVEAFR